MFEIMFLRKLINSLSRFNICIEVKERDNVRRDVISSLIRRMKRVYESESIRIYSKSEMIREC
jgi:hypothetical protein